MSTESFKPISHIQGNGWDKNGKFYLYTNKSKDGETKPFDFGNCNIGVNCSLPVHKYFTGPKNMLPVHKQKIFLLRIRSVGLKEAWTTWPWPSLIMYIQPIYFKMFKELHGINNLNMHLLEGHFQFTPPPVFFRFLIYGFPKSVIGTRGFRACWFRIWHPLGNMRYVWGAGINFYQNYKIYWKSDINEKTWQNRTPSC